MSKRPHKRINPGALLQGVKAISKMAGLLNAKYDPVIMAEILETPEVKEVIRQEKIKNGPQLELFKGFIVKQGTYDFFVKEKNKKEGAL